MATAMERGHLTSVRAVTRVPPDATTTMDGREKATGFNRPPDPPRVGLNPIEFPHHEESMGLSAQKGRTRGWRQTARCYQTFYASAYNGECPIQIDTSTPSCRNSGFGAGLCTSSSATNKGQRGMLRQWDERQGAPDCFRETCLSSQDPANGKRDLKREREQARTAPAVDHRSPPRMLPACSLQEETASPS